MKESPSRITVHVRIYVASRSGHHLVVPVEQASRPFPADFGVPDSEVVLFVGIVFQMEEHYLGPKMITIVIGRMYNQAPNRTVR